MLEIKGVKFKYDIGEIVLIKKEVFHHEFLLSCFTSRDIINDRIGQIVCYYTEPNFESLMRPYYGIQFDNENSKGIDVLLYTINKGITFKNSRYFPENKIELDNSLIDF